jgi:hypothetical protein
MAKSKFRRRRPGSETWGRMSIVQPVSARARLRLKFDDGAKMMLDVPEVDRVAVIRTRLMSVNGGDVLM